MNMGMKTRIHSAWSGVSGIYQVVYEKENK